MCFQRTANLLAKKIKMLSLFWSKTYCTYEGHSLLFVSIDIMCEFVYIIRYLGTFLGSSVISTTVLGDDQPVSTAVHYQLQHIAQVGEISQISTIFFLIRHNIHYLTHTYYRTPLVLCMIQCVPFGILISRKYKRTF